MATLLWPPTQNGLQKQLNAQLDQGTTSSATLNNVTGIDNRPGIMVVNRIDTTGELKSASEREYITYGGTSGNTVTGLARGLGGSTDQDHAIGSVVEFIPDVVWAEALMDAVALVVNQSDISTVNTTNVVTPAGTQTLTNKTLTSPVLNTGVSGTAVLDEDNMASDSATKLATQQSIKAYVDGRTLLDGWITVSDTLTYASPTSFTIAGVDRTSTYTKGTRIKLTQTSAKYFVVTSSSFSTDTTVNVTGGSDYTVANAAITSPYYSYQLNPQGFPGWFAYAPTWTSTGGTPAIGSGSLSFRFCVNGETVHVKGKLVGAADTTWTGTEYRFTLPITGVLEGSVFSNPGSALVYDTSATLVETAVAVMASTTQIGIYPETTTGASSVGATTPFTWATSDQLLMSLTYEI